MTGKMENAVDLPSLLSRLVSKNQNFANLWYLFHVESHILQTHASSTVLRV